MAHTPSDHTDRRIAANFSQGWGFAIFITLLAVASFVIAGMIKRATYHDPTDVTAPYAHEGAGAHGAPAAQGAGSTEGTQPAH
jgi:hypothetical protein